MYGLIAARQWTTMSEQLFGSHSRTNKTMWYFIFFVHFKHSVSSLYTWIENGSVFLSRWQPSCSDNKMFGHDSANAVVCGRQKKEPASLSPETSQSQHCTREGKAMWRGREVTYSTFTVRVQRKQNSPPLQPVITCAQLYVCVIWTHTGNDECTFFIAGSLHVAIVTSEGSNRVWWWMFKDARTDTCINNSSQTVAKL